MTRLIVVLGGLTMLSLGMASSPVAVDSVLLVESAVDLVAACQSECVPCNNEKGHEAEANKEGPLASEPHPCEELDPCDDKTVCFSSLSEPEDNQSEAVRKAVLNHDYGRLAILVGAHPGRVVFNHARAAVQLVDCKGKVVAHYPVPRAAFAEASRAD